MLSRPESFTQETRHFARLDSVVDHTVLTVAFIASSMFIIPRRTLELLRTNGLDGIKKRYIGFIEENRYPPSG